MTFLYREYIAYARFLEAWAEKDDQRGQTLQAHVFRAQAYSILAKAGEVKYVYVSEHYIFKHCLD